MSEKSILVFPKHGMHAKVQPYTAKDFITTSNQIKPSEVLTENTIAVLNTVTEYLKEDSRKYTGGDLLLNYKFSFNFTLDSTELNLIYKVIKSWGYEVSLSTNQNSNSIYFKITVPNIRSFEHDDDVKVTPREQALIDKIKSELAHAEINNTVVDTLSGPVQVTRSENILAAIEGWQRQYKIIE